MAKHRIYNSKKSQSQKTQNINRFTFPTERVSNIVKIVCVTRMVHKIFQSTIDVTFFPYL